jgi:hypothetical protein
MKNIFKTPSKASPRAGSKRGCLCEDETYSTKCCDGSLQAQGIGKTATVNEPAPTQTEVSGVRTIDTSKRITTKQVFVGVQRPCLFY